MSNQKTVFHYHHRTKHHLDRYARSLGYMDWNNMPDPFRYYEGAERIPLPLSEKDAELPYACLYTDRPDGPAPLSIKTVAAILELGLGLSAKKKLGPSEWLLRMNPSSGNLHPTESYVILPPLEGLPACIAHYNSYLHSLEKRADLDSGAAKKLADAGGFGIVITSISWREAWKYGERAFRYCNHDVGHALAGLRFSANLEGWKMILQPGIADQHLDALLGFDKIDWVECEAEHSDCVCWLFPSGTAPKDAAKFVESLPLPEYTHPPNRLSKGHTPWELIDQVIEASRAPGLVGDAQQLPAPAVPKIDLESALSAREIIRRRRSAQAYDFETSRTDSRTFMAMLERTLPATGAPFDAFPYEPQCHLAIFVHRVDGLDPGLYLLLRNPAHEQELKAELRDGFLWQSVKDDLPLFLLHPADLRNIARNLSCHQDIAGDSAFSLGMLCRFEPVLRDAAWMYPRLFWETGMIGQVLYLEAEAHGLRGTGIGCFFDDSVHELLGISGDLYQSLYHFTVGSPLKDRRVQTLDPYGHLGSGRT
ncbi:MAG: SagB/ThcOx family dehydrogenase [Planctomycetota bacterium]|jgi:SagB-type dehydrogenase family enzyme